MTQAPKPPPQKFSPGGRRVLDAQWLSYVRRTNNTGSDKHLIHTELIIKGIQEFNDGKFQACHETWESAWVESLYPERLFLLSLTKFGSGFAHALRRNPKGVTRLLDDAIRYVRPFGPTYAGIDVEQFISDVTTWLYYESYGPPFPEIRFSE